MPGWCWGNQCPAVGQLGFSATRQLVQALLLFFPSWEERQANKNLLLGLKRPLRKPDQSGAWKHQVAPCAGCAFLFSPNWWGGCQPHSWVCKLAPDPVRSQQGSSRGSPLPRPALYSASAFLSSLPPAAPGTLIKAASTVKEEQKERKKKKKVHLCTWFWSPLARGGIFRVQHLLKEATMASLANLPADACSERETTVRQLHPTCVTEIPQATEEQWTASPYTSPCPIS